MSEGALPDATEAMLPGLSGCCCCCLARCRAETRAGVDKLLPVPSTGLPDGDAVVPAFAVFDEDGSARMVVLAMASVNSAVDSSFERVRPIFLEDCCCPILADYDGLSLMGNAVLAIRG